MTTSRAARVTYRLWRTSSILCFVGAGEFAVLAWLRRDPWIAGLCIPLIAVAAYATRRAAGIRRSWGA
ncbi:MAG TPA: hypothetical protein VFI39_06830 [Gemmatimonadales bacterium]|nr:hypothetical protein [Gemmatimonadales bacterium]